MKNKQTWKTILQLAVSVLTAAITALSTTSCMGGRATFPLAFILCAFMTQKRNETCIFEKQCLNLQPRSR